MTEFRTERDSLGEVEVPAGVLWGAHTQRAMANFPISGQGLDPTVIAALARIKAAAATVNGELGVIDPRLADAIIAAAHEIADGGHADQFPVDIYSTGSGTSFNMNVNEVVATLASRGRAGIAVHPNDHVNASQSSNDVFPSAVQLAAVLLITHDLIPALGHLLSTLDAKATEFDYVVKAGRTHLMDATPVTLGQEFHGYATQIRLGIERIQSSLPRLAALTLGGTAVGTGLNAPIGFGERVIDLLRQGSGLPLAIVPNHFAAQGGADAVVEMSGQLRCLAVALYKVASDIRWLGSGPHAGLAELRLPALQPGSSAMPGKVNPVLCEAVRQVCARVIGSDATIAFAGSQGDFELNTMQPVMAANLVESIQLLARVSGIFADRCVAGLQADASRCLAYAESSPAVVTALNRYLGYDEAAAIAAQALAEARGIRDVVAERGHLASGRISAEQLTAALDVTQLIGP